MATRTSRILGPDGLPLRVEDRTLRARTARPAVVGRRRAQQWQGVIATLTPERLRQLLRSVAQGVWTPDFFELAEEMEERDLHYRGVLQQRRLTAANAAVDVVPASEDAPDQEAARLVRRDILGSKGLRAMLLDLLDAVGKGVAVVEVVWTRRGGLWVPAGYHRVDPRWLAWDPDDGESPWLLGAGDDPAAARDPRGARGWFRDARPLLEDPGKFIYFPHRSKAGLPTRGGLAYAVSVVYLLKSMSVRDWWAFARAYGQPLRIGKYGPDADDDDIATLVEAVSAIAEDAGCVIPDSMLIEFAQAARAGASGSGETLFQGMSDWADKQVSKAVVGQTMTVDDGSSLSQAEIHDDIRRDLVEDDVRQLWETVSGTLVEWYCDLNAGLRGMPAARPAGCPRIAPPPAEDELPVDAIVKLAAAGLRVPQGWLRERLGVPAPAGDEEVLGAAPSGPPSLIPPPPRGMFHAEDGSGWLEVADALTRPVLEALEAAAGADEFLALASRLDVPRALADDLALACFEARVSGETDPEP